MIEDLEAIIHRLLRGKLSSYSALNCVRGSNQHQNSREEFKCVLVGGQ